LVIRVSLNDWLDSGRLRRHPSSARELADLLALVDRDVRDAQIEATSADRRFATACNGALQLATVVLHAAGYRTAGPGHHSLTIQVLPEVMGAGQAEVAAFLDVCRMKRNVADYDRMGAVSESDVAELLELVDRLRADVTEWLDSHHPELRGAS
jgi:hypothetical protein